MRNFVGLPKSFFERNVVEVARDLLGKTLVFGKRSGYITETEAYRGADDPASHAFRGLTPRSSLMFGEPGYSYVYLIYGMYHCLNIISEASGQAAGVLIRGLKMGNLHLDGPGKICRHLGISKTDNGIHLINNPDFHIAEGLVSVKYKTTSRIGIKQGQDKPWRFLLTKHE